MENFETRQSQENGPAGPRRQIDLKNDDEAEVNLGHGSAPVQRVRESRKQQSGSMSVIRIKARQRRTWRS
jgi:hypothetical protein